MRTEGQTVFVPWHGKVLQGTLVSENHMMGMTAVRIPLQGCHPIALFHPSHVYESVPQTADCVPNNEERVPKIAESVPKESLTSMCEAFKKSHWDNEHNHLRTDSLDEFYNLWRDYVAGKSSHTHVTCDQEEKSHVAKKPAKAIQLSIFD